MQVLLEAPNHTLGWSSTGWHQPCWLGMEHNLHHSSPSHPTLFCAALCSTHIRVAWATRGETQPRPSGEVGCSCPRCTGAVVAVCSVRTPPHQSRSCKRVRFLRALKGNHTRVRYRSAYTYRLALGSTAWPFRRRTGAKGRGSGRNSDEQYPGAQASLEPWRVPGCGRLSCPRSPGPSFPPRPRLARECGNYNASSISDGQEGVLWGGLDPSGLRLRLLQNRSVTQVVWATEVLVQGTVLRTAYPYVHCTCTISSRSSVTASHGVSGLSVPTRDVPRRSNIYLSSLPPSSISPSLSCPLCSWRFITSQSSSSSKQIDNLAVIPPIFSSITHKILTMAGSAPAASKDIKSVLENKPLKFKFKTGGASYIAQVHTDRSS